MCLCMPSAAAHIFSQISSAQYSVNCHEVLFIDSENNLENINTPTPAPQKPHQQQQQQQQQQENNKNMKNNNNKKQVQRLI